MAAVNSTFSTPPFYYLSLFDTVSFFLSLNILAGIWIFILYHPRKRPWFSASITPKQPLNAVVTCLSLSATCIPPVISFGFISEVYKNGTLIWFHVVGILIATIITAHVYISVYFQSEVKNSFEYIGRRFSLQTRKLVAFFICVQYLIFLPFVLITPAIIFKHIISDKQWVMLVTFLALTIPPTFCNNLRATSLNDFLTFITTFILLSLIISQRSSDLGGLHQVWNITEENGAFQLPSISSDPYERHTVWSLVIGGSVTWCSFMCFNPVIVNRCLSLKSIRKSQIALWFSFFFTLILISATSFYGMICFGFFHNCDPLTIFKDAPFYLEELSAYLLMSKDEGNWLPGIFVGIIIAWSIGYVAYSLNIVCDLMIFELLRPFATRSSKNTIRLLRSGLTFSTVVLIVVLTMFYPYARNIFMMAIQSFTAIGAPLLGLFTLALFIPWANAKGSVVGFLTGLFISFWMTVGHQAYNFDKDSTLLLTTNCIQDNKTYYNVTHESTGLTDDLPSLNATFTGSTINIVVVKMYHLSYLWIPPISTGTVLIVGLMISLCTGNQCPIEVDTTLLCPAIAFCVRKSSLFRQEEVSDVDTSDSKSVEITAGRSTT